MDQSNAPDTAQLMEQILYEVKRVVVGQDRFLERVMVAMLAQGHLLVEGVPGLAKTLTVKTLANVVQGRFKRLPHAAVACHVHERIGGDAFQAGRGAARQGMVRTADEMKTVGVQQVHVQAGPFGRAGIGRAVRGAGQELHAGGRRAEQSRPPPFALVFLMGMAPHHAAHPGMRGHQFEQLGAVLQCDGVQPRTADRHRRMMET